MMSPGMLIMWCASIRTIWPRTRPTTTTISGGGTGSLLRTFCIPRTNIIARQNIPNPNAPRGRGIQGAGWLADSAPARGGPAHDTDTPGKGGGGATPPPPPAVRSYRQCFKPATPLTGFSIGTVWLAFMDLHTFPIQVRVE